MNQSTHAHTDLTSVTNHVYEMIKQGEQGHEYEQVDVSPGTDFLVTMAANEMYKMPYPQPLPTIPLYMTLPTSGDVGVAREDEEEDVYDNIPGDQWSHDMSQRKYDNSAVINVYLSC